MFNHVDLLLIHVKSGVHRHEYVHLAPWLMVHSDTSGFNPFFKNTHKAATYMPTHISELLNLQSSI